VALLRRWPGPAGGRALLEALAAAGYDGPVSIEHEDPELTPEDGIEASLDGLRAALAVAVPGTES
jgi:sugar phosphate isomerase/epimerase